MSRFFLLAVALALAVFPSTGVALPQRLVLALDGVAYRDMQALQAGITRTNFWGRTYQLRAFTTNEGYFPVSRMISTFPSTSDVAWTEIFGDRPLPGYQRTYYSKAANSQIAINGVTTTMEHERQMNWQVQDGFLRSMGYVFPFHMYEYEVREMIKHFREGGNKGNYYAYVRASDDAQHMGRDIFGMLCELDRQLQELRKEYRRQEGRDLEIVILSDHGNNHAGRGKRVEIRSYLEKEGYRISKSLKNSNDVVLPTSGIESWVEVHNVPGETEKLAQLLTHLEGVDVVTARIPGKTNHFLVMDTKGDRAVIEWRPERNTFRYTAEKGDPIDYLPVVEALSKKNLLDSDGFATADDWMAETLTHRYPLAPERISRGLSRVALNPATILISLENGYVHDEWLVDSGSRLVKMGGTHGALDDINSDGILLSNFIPTRDTATDRVADLFDGFPNVVDYRVDDDGAEWVLGNELMLARVRRGPLDGQGKSLSGGEIFLRIWTPKFAGSGADDPVEIEINRTGVYSTARMRRWEMNAPAPQSADPKYVLGQPALDPGKDVCERIYAIPPGMKLEPQQAYEISGSLHDGTGSRRIFKFIFHTDDHGLPIAY